MQLKFNKNSGFTLIELLVVIAIIGLLASIVLVSLNDSRAKAKAARVLSDFQQIEKAFYLFGGDENWSQWPHENTWEIAPYNCTMENGINDEPTVGCIAANTGLGKYISGAPGIEANKYTYDNDGEDADPDGDGCGYGANGVIFGFWDPAFIEIAEIMDDMVDDGDGEQCGKIVWVAGAGNLVGYRLGLNPQDY